MPPRSDKPISSAASVQSLLAEHEALEALVKAQKKEIEELKAANEQLKPFAPLLELKETLEYVQNQNGWRGEFAHSPFGRGHFCIRGSLGYPKLVGVFPEVNRGVDLNKLGVGLEFDLEHSDYDKIFWSAWDLGHTMVSAWRAKVEQLRPSLRLLVDFLALTAEEIEQIRAS